MRLPNQTAVDIRPLPSRGNNPYSQEVRSSYERSFESGIPPPDEWIADQWEHGLQPADSTLR